MKSPKRAARTARRQALAARARLERKEGGRGRAARFMALCLGCFVVLAALYFALRSGSTLEPFLALNARAASLILNVFGAATQVEGPLILADDSSFRVIAECTSIIPTGAFLCGVVAWPCGARWKLAGVVFGLALFFVVNVVRIVSLFYVAREIPGLLDLFHLYVWGTLTVALIAVAWYLWARRAMRPHPA